MEIIKTSLLLGLVLFVGLSYCQSPDDDDTKQNITEKITKKALSVFNVVKFPNTACGGSQAQNGTCYTSSECSNKKGTNTGSCANGYGVCCVFTIGCGQKSSENSTYFQSTSTTQPAGQCIAQICRCNTNICQLRIDFTTFMITGPNTLTASVAKALGGAMGAVGTLPAAAVAVNDVTNCLTDKFSVTGNGGHAPPVICGNNNGFHMYVDADDTCNELNFQLGPTGIGAAIPTRTWNMKISQISCNDPNAAPSGCTQYFFGTTFGKINTYNWLGGTQLANQQQNICFRREKGFCSVCFSQATATDFKISGMTTKGFDNQLTCCGYGTGGGATKGYDCLLIPGARNPSIATNPFVPGQFCGQKLAGTNNVNAQKTVCTKQTPFMVSFLSDGFTWMGAAVAGTGGFNLDFFQKVCP